MSSWKQRCKKAEYLLAVAKYDSRSEQDKDDRLLAYYAQRTQELETAARAVLVEAESGLCRSTLNAVRLRLRPLITQEAAEPENAELAEARAEIKEIPPSRLLDDLYYMIDDWHEWHDVAKSIKRLRECAKTTERRVKTRIEGLRKERDEWEEKVVAQANVGTLFVVPNQEFESDARLGELVRGMREGTRLVRTRLYYWPEFLEGEQWRNIPLAGLRSPAEALRAIQEVKEHRCE